MSHNSSNLPTAVHSNPRIYVEQGPEWLAHLLYDPPLWAQHAVSYAVAIVAIAAIATVYHVGLPDDIWPEVAENVAIAAGVAGATRVMTWLPGGYVLDLLVGLVVGYGLAVAATRRWVAPALWPDAVHGDNQSTDAGGGRQ